LRRPGMPIIDVRLVQRIPMPTEEEARAALPLLATYASWSSRETVHAGLIGARSISAVDEDGIVFGAAASSGNLVHVLDDVGRWVGRKDLFGPVFDNVRAKFAAELGATRSAFDRHGTEFTAALHG